jgi:ABC-type sugar transport system ATPase subunit
VSDVAGALGIDDVLARRPGQLSSGQRQRVAMGRAIIRRPSLFLMDEPLSNLDSGLRAQLRAEISSLVRELGVTTVYVTHDQAEALTMADRVAILRKGVLQDVGTPTEVYRRPGTLFVATFLGSPRMNLIEASVYVHLDRYIALHLGEQSLYLPWHDMRARQVAHYHGERIVIGVRSEALSPVASEATGDVLHGRVQFIEHQGTSRWPSSTWARWRSCSTSSALPVPTPTEAAASGGCPASSAELPRSSPNQKNPATAPRRPERPQACSTSRVGMRRRANTQSWPCACSPIPRCASASR